MPALADNAVFNPAQPLANDIEKVVIGIVVVAVAIGALTTVLIIHHKNQRNAITGCVISGAAVCRRDTVAPGADYRTLR
jgi:hypothetical protein